MTTVLLLLLKIQIQETDVIGENHRQELNVN